MFRVKRYKAGKMNVFSKPVYVLYETFKEKEQGQLVAVFESKSDALDYLEQELANYGWNYEDSKEALEQLQKEGYMKRTRGCFYTLTAANIIKRPKSMNYITDGSIWSSSKRKTSS